jgi:hypothetical protein
MPLLVEALLMMIAMMCMAAWETVLDLFRNLWIAVLAWWDWWREQT